MRTTVHCIFVTLHSRVSPRSALEQRSMKDADYVHTDLRNNMTGEHATCSPKSQIPCDAAMKGKLSGGLVGDCDDDPQKGANERAIGRSRQNCAPAEGARRVGESVVRSCGWMGDFRKAGRGKLCS